MIFSLRCMPSLHYKTFLFNPLRHLAAAINSGLDKDVSYIGVKRPRALNRGGVMIRASRATDLNHHDGCNAGVSVPSSKPIFVRSFRRISAAAAAIIMLPFAPGEIESNEG